MIRQIPSHITSLVMEGLEHSRTNMWTTTRQGAQPGVNDP